MRVNDTTISDAMRETARDTLTGARKDLTKYRARVGRAVVRGTDTVKSIGTLYHHATSSLWAIADVCRQFAGNSDLDRLYTILERHCLRLTRQFNALHDRDRGQVHAADLAEIEQKFA